MHQVTSPLKTKRAGFALPMTATGSKALLDNGFAAVGLRRAAGSGLPGDNFGFHTCMCVCVVEQLLQFGFDDLFVFARNHATVKQQLTAVWHHVVRMAAVDAGYRQAGVADQIVAAATHLLVVGFFNQP